MGPRWSPRLPPSTRWHAAPEHDLPSRPTRAVLLIASTPRVGSTYFQAALNEAGSFGICAQYAIPHELRASRQELGRPRLSGRGRVQALRARWAGEPAWEMVGDYSRRSLTRYLKDVARRRTSEAGVFSMRIQYETLVSVFEHHAVTFDIWNAPVHWMWIRRHDRLSQAVSLAIAKQTRQWRPEDPAAGAVHFDLDGVVRELDSIERQERGWETYFEGRSGHYATAWMEDIITDPQPALNVAAEMTGVPALPRDVSRAMWTYPNTEIRAEFVRYALTVAPELRNRRWATSA